MGNCISRLCKTRKESPEVDSRDPPVAESAPTKEEIIRSLEEVSRTTELDKFVSIIKQVMEEKKADRGSTSAGVKAEDKASTSTSAEEKKRMWSSFVTSGAKFLKFVNSHTEKMKDEKDIFNPENSTVVADILREIGHLHWAVGGLAITAYLIEKSAKVNANKEQALELLSNMVDLATTVKKLRDVMPEEEEKFKNAAMLIVQGSIMCVSQIYSEKIFSFLKSSINSVKLNEISNKIVHLYRDLDLAISTEIARRQPILLPVPKSFYPKDAVGIENAEEEVIKLLDMTSENELRLAVVIYGFGGIGKTTLATAVVAKLDLLEYNYAHVTLDEDTSKNKLKKIQEQILHDACPSFHAGSRIDLPDCRAGRIHLIEAFKCPENKPIFLFIDNALRLEDLRELLPEDLSVLPKRSRIFLTTRQLDATDIFLTSGIDRKDFLMKPLDNVHAEKMLFKDSDSRERISDDDRKRILRICGGVPLALRIVRGHLAKMKYNAARCTGILDALEKGMDVKEENLSQRVIQYVYNEMEDSTKDALLDICCFFSGDLRRHVEYVVGEEDVKSLEEAALFTSFVEDQKYDSVIYYGEERLRVHDIVRAKGQSMAASTRIMDSESFCETAQSETKLNGVKGLELQEREYVLDLKHLNLMRHSLRILSLGGCISTSAERSSIKFNELRYLMFDWYEDPIGPVKVEEADMLGWYEGPIGPNGIRLNKLPKRLRYLQGNVTKESSTFTQNDSLEELCLWGDVTKQLPEGLHQLRSLKILILFLCLDMEEFPEQVCELSSLIKLQVSWWTSLKRVPESFGRLKGLTHLQISNCSELEELPSSFGELKALEYLSLRGCKKLKELPGGLESLKYLNVAGCGKLSVDLYKTKRDLKINYNLRG